MNTLLIFLFVLLLFIGICSILRERNIVELSGGDMNPKPSSIPISIKRLLPANGKWPQVHVISNQIIQSNGLSAFRWSEKTDGLHMNLGIWEHRIYNLSNPRDIRFIGIEVPYDNIAIIDCELYHEKYYIFDSPMIDSEDISKKSFIERLDKVKAISDKLGDMFIVKEFYDVKSIKELTNFIENDISPITGNEIDGVILQLISPSYFGGKGATSYKLKPRYLHTVDFRLRYVIEEKRFYLYLGGTYRDFLYNLQARPKENKYQLKHTGVDISRNRRKEEKLKSTFEVLFSSPVFPDLYYYVNKNVWNKHGYSRRHIIDADTLIRQINIDPMKFDGKIVEMSLNDNNEWIPLRVRDDKPYPNGYVVGLSNVSQAFDPIVEPSENYFAKPSELTAADEKLQSLVHRVSGIYRKYIIESLVNPLGPNINAMDLCGGRGADELNLYCNGVVNLFVVDSDSTALHQYIDRSLYMRMKLAQPGGEYKSLTEDFVDRVHSKDKTGNLFYLNVLLHTLGEKKTYTNLLDDLITRYEWERISKLRHDIAKDAFNRLELVLMNFAIHYICTKKTNITALAWFISTILRSNGIFIVTYYDGDEILSRVKDGIAEIGPFRIQIVKDTRDLVIAKMPLPTIQAGDEFYREEPLVRSSTLEPMEKYLTCIDEFFVCDRAYSYISDEDRMESAYEYYKLIKCRVYKTK